MRSSSVRGDRRAVDVDRCGERAAGRIDDVDAVAGASAQHGRDLARIIGGKRDALAERVDAFDEKAIAQRRHRYSALNASLTRSKNERSPSSSASARAYSSSNSRSRLPSLRGTAMRTVTTWSPRMPPRTAGMP